MLLGSLAEQFIRKFQYHRYNRLMPTTGYDLLIGNLLKSNVGESLTHLKSCYRNIQSQSWEHWTRLKVSCEKRCKINTKIGLYLFKTAFSKQTTRIGIISLVWHEIVFSFVQSNWVSCVKVFSVRLGIKLKSLSREWTCRHLSLNTKTSALLQDKLFFSNYSQVLDDHFSA